MIEKLPKVPEVKNKVLRRVYSYAVIAVYVPAATLGHTLTAVYDAFAATREDTRYVLDLHRKAMDH